MHCGVRGLHSKPRWTLGLPASLPDRAPGAPIPRYGGEREQEGRYRRCLSPCSELNPGLLWAPVPTVACIPDWASTLGVLPHPGQAVHRAAQRPGPRLAEGHRFACVRGSLKYLADAYTGFCEGDGHPCDKTRCFTPPGFTIPDNVGARDGRLCVPKVGWFKMGGGGNPLRGASRSPRASDREKPPRGPNGMRLSATKDPLRAWGPGAAGGAPGLNRNAGQATDSDGGRVPAVRAGCPHQAQTRGTGPQPCSTTVPTACAGPANDGCVPGCATSSRRHPEGRSTLQSGNASYPRQASCWQDAGRRLCHVLPSPLPPDCTARPPAARSPMCALPGQPRHRQGPELNGRVLWEQQETCLHHQGITAPLPEYLNGCVRSMVCWVTRWTGLKWRFPPRNGGIDCVNDPSGAHFSDASMTKLVRELVRNALNAGQVGLSEPVTVTRRPA